MPSRAYNRFGRPQSVSALHCRFWYGHNLRGRHSQGASIWGGRLHQASALRPDALYQRAAALPKVDIAEPPTAIGRNTVHAMQSGIFFGYVGMVEGMVARIKAELGLETKVVATGGLAPIIAKGTDVIDIIEPWLTLDGLRMIYLMNKGQHPYRQPIGYPVNIK